MHSAIVFAAGLVVAGAALAQSGERREVAAHVHGKSTLRIAIESDRIIMEFDAPGLDVIGFEHTPATAKEIKAVDDAKAALAQPLALFDFGVAAGCTVQSASVNFLVESEHDGTSAATSPAAATVGADKPAAITSHTGFESSYELACANISAIREIRLGFLEQFANAMIVEVQLVAPKGQTTFDVVRPVVSGSLAGLI